MMNLKNQKFYQYLKQANFKFFVSSAAICYFVYSIFGVLHQYRWVDEIILGFFAFSLLGWILMGNKKETKPATAKATPAKKKILGQWAEGGLYSQGNELPRFPATDVGMSLTDIYRYCSLTVEGDTVYLIPTKQWYLHEDVELNLCAVLDRDIQVLTEFGYEVKIIHPYSTTFYRHFRPQKNEARLNPEGLVIPIPKHLINYN